MRKLGKAFHSQIRPIDDFFDKKIRGRGREENIIGKIITNKTSTSTVVLILVPAFHRDWFFYLKIILSLFLFVYNFVAHANLKNIGSGFRN